MPEEEKMSVEEESARSIKYSVCISIRLISVICDLFVFYGHSEQLLCQNPEYVPIP